MISEGIKFNELVSLHLAAIKELHELKMIIQEYYLVSFPESPSSWADSKQNIYAMKLEIINLRNKIKNANSQ